VHQEVRQGPYKYGSAMLAIVMFEFQVMTLRLNSWNAPSYIDEAFMDEFFRASIPHLRTSPI
jgi:hypothetical protein